MEACLRLRSRGFARRKPPNEKAVYRVAPVDGPETKHGNAVASEWYTPWGAVDRGAGAVQPRRQLSAQDREKALAARQAKVLAGTKYRRDWLDAGLWDSLARKFGVKLPMWHRPPTARSLKTWFRNLDGGSFERVYGCSPTRLIGLNPRAPLRVFVGHLLEHVDAKGSVSGEVRAPGT